MPHPLQGCQAVGDLFKTGAETALQQQYVIAGRLTRPQETGIGHHDGGGKIAGQMTAIQSLPCPFGKAGTRDKSVDFRFRLQHRKLECRRKSPAGRVEQL